MAPIHADEMNRAIAAVTFQKRKCATQEIDELRLTHLPRSHGKFAMVNLPFTADISVNFDVVGRVGEASGRRFAGEMLMDRPPVESHLLGQLSRRLPGTVS